jgi:hypothetical protein
MTTVCLQGGNELAPPCRDMDKHLLGIAPSSAVVVVPLASNPVRTTSGRARTRRPNLSALGRPGRTRRPPRPSRCCDRRHGRGARRADRRSPRQLVEGLTTSGLDAVIRDAAANGAVVMGASAGAMVACATTLLPQWHRDPLVGAGNGLVEGYVVVPHFDGKRTAWVRVAPGAGNRSTVLGTWRVLGSNQRRLSRRFYRPFPLTTRATRLGSHVAGKRRGARRTE